MRQQRGASESCARGAPDRQADGTGEIVEQDIHADEFYAHSDPNRPITEWHKLEDHLRATAKLAREFAELFGAGDWAYLAGLWHDLGKYSEDFQKRLRGDPGRVDHSTAGAQWVDGHAPDPQAGRLLAHAVAGHHGGLPDGSAPNHSCLRNRLKRQVPDFSAASQDVLRIHQDLSRPAWLDQYRYRFQLGFFTRMLFSCLVDADFLDTERFLKPDAAAMRGAFPTLADMERRLSATLGQLCAKVEPTAVNRARRRVLEECVRAADLPPGFFSLTVPTGGGKTYASLAFALRHCLRYGLTRVIYALPFTTIIEQNAAKFREALQDCAHGVVEHHSGLVVDDSDHVAKLAVENWDAPLVVTTNVQFFESLYSQRVSSCRKLHNLTRAVIILDEAQALPVSLLAPCLEALRELVTDFGATVVLCTATQPALSQRSGFEFGLEGVREIMPDTRALSEELKRVHVELIGRKTDDELARLIRGHPRSLCVVNTRRQARGLFEQIRSEDGTFHLSALMCPAHRSRVLDTIRHRLADPNSVCRVVSTQLVEAGVDVDFPVVFRAMAGLDSIAQAAGRCNREGRLSWGRVYVFHGEQPAPSGFLRQTAEAADLILPRFADNLLGLDAVNAYFERYYWTQTGYMDRQDILARLNEIAMSNLWIPFETVGRDFRIIRDEGLSVLIPYDDTARDLLASLRQTGLSFTLARALQPYGVQVYSRDFAALQEVGAVDLVTDRCAILIREDGYDPQTGLSQQVSDVYNPEMLYSE